MGRPVSKATRRLPSPRGPCTKWPRCLCGEYFPLFSHHFEPDDDWHMTPDEADAILLVAATTLACMSIHCPDRLHRLLAVPNTCTRSSIRSETRSVSDGRTSRGLARARARLLR
jgi:hypothetical protein